MKTTVTTAIQRAGQERELSITRDGDDGVLEVFVPPAARTASCIFTIDAAELLKLAQAFVPEELLTPVVTQIPGQTNVYDMLEVCGCSRHGDKITAVSRSCPIHYAPEVKP